MCQEVQSKQPYCNNCYVTNCVLGATTAQRNFPFLVFGFPIFLLNQLFAEAWGVFLKIWEHPGQASES